MERIPKRARRKSWKKSLAPALPSVVFLTTIKPMNANKMDDGNEKISPSVLNVGFLPKRVADGTLSYMVNVKTMKTSSGKVRKRQTTQTKRRKLRGTVVKMLAVMDSNPDSTDPVRDFLVTGRTGRRNALADILGPHATVTSGDLPERLQSLTTVDKSSGSPEGDDENADATCQTSHPEEQATKDAKQAKKSTNEKSLKDESPSNSTN